MRSSVFLPALAALILSPVALLAEDVAATGVLMTDTGRPIAGYPVIIEGESGQYVAVTDADGSYAVEGLPEGHYTAAPAGDLTLKRAFSVETIAREPGFLDFLLQRAPKGDAQVLAKIPTIELKTKIGN